MAQATLDIQQLTTERPFQLPNQHSGGIRGWQKEFLPWTTGDMTLFRRIGSARLWDLEASRDLWATWWKIAILMADPTINEIQVQATTGDPTRCSVISKGPRGMLVHPDLEMSTREILEGLNQIASAGLSLKGIRGHLDTSDEGETEVILTTELDDGPRVSRLTAVVAPAANAPALAIRRFPVGGIPRKVITGREAFSRYVHDFAWPGVPVPAMSNPLVEILQEAALENPLVPWASCPSKALAWTLQTFATDKNLLVFGETGSGKTTMLQTLGRDTNHNERIAVVEVDADEVNDIPHYNQIRLKATTPEKDAKRTPDKINAAVLRLTPNLVIYGELRGGEAYSANQLSLSGHKLMASMHAGTRQKAVRRMISMTQAGAPAGTDSEAVRADVYDSTNILMHVAQQVHMDAHGMPKTVQRVESISEFIMDDDGRHRFQSIFHTELDSQNAPCLVWSGSLGSLEQALIDRKQPIPEWALKAGYRPTKG